MVCGARRARGQKINGRDAVLQVGATTFAWSRFVAGLTADGITGTASGAFLPAKSVFRRR